MRYWKLKGVPEQSVIKPVCNFSTVNINGSCQLGWHLESNGHRSCHTNTLLYRSCRNVNLTDDQIQNHMSFEKICLQSNKPEYLYYFQKFPTFIQKYPLKHQYLLRASYIQMIPTISSFHLHKKLNLKLTF